MPVVVKSRASRGELTGKTLPAPHILIENDGAEIEAEGQERPHCVGDVLGNIIRTATRPVYDAWRMWLRPFRLRYPLRPKRNFCLATATGNGLRYTETRLNAHFAQLFARRSGGSGVCGFFSPITTAFSGTGAPASRRFSC